MKKFRILLILTIGMSLFGCKKEEMKDNTPRVVKDCEMNLDNMEVGQEFKYILLLGKNYRDNAKFDFVYKEDTLVVKVIEVGLNTVTVEEYLTEGSKIFASSESYYWRPELRVKTRWKTKGNIIEVEHLDSIPFSHLLFSRAIKMNLGGEQKVEIKGWKTTYPYREHSVQLYAEDYIQQGCKYEHLNVFIDNEPMSSDGNGSTTIFSRKYGFVRTSTYGWWSSEGWGWDRIPNYK